MTTTRRTILAAGLGAATLSSTSIGSSAERATDRDLDRLDALGLAEWVRRKRVSPAELLDHALARARALQGPLNFMSIWDEEHARKRLAAGLPQGPFSGVPFLLKDLWVALAGTVSTNGSRYFAGTRADYDGELVRRYEQAGLVIFGKTTSPEFGLSATTETVLNGRTVNPWNPARIAGGSSGGSAVAVATRVVPMAHASDGGGSIRIPSACCGAFGLKPSRGRVPFPVMRFEGWSGLSTNHAITMSVRDSAALLDATAGPAPGDTVGLTAARGEFLAATQKKGRRLRIAVMRKPFAGTPVDPACEALLDDAAKLCASLGHRVVDAAPRIDGLQLAATMGATIAVNILKTLQDQQKVVGRAWTAQDIEPVTNAVAEGGKAVSATDYVRTREYLENVARIMADFHRDYDVLLTPTLGSPPLPLGVINTSPPDFDTFAKTSTAFAAFTGFANATGQPSMSVPLGRTADGLPLAALFTGPYASEAMLLGLAAELESARPWRNEIPPSARTG